MHWEGTGCCGACQVTAEGIGVPDSSELAPSLAGVSAFRCGVGVFRGGFHPFLWLSEFGSVMYTCVHPCFPHPLAPDPPGAVREGLLFPRVGGQAEPLGLESAPPRGGRSLCPLWVACLLEALTSEGYPLRWGVLHSMSLEIGGQGSSLVPGVPRDVKCSGGRGQLHVHDWL